MADIRIKDLATTASSAASDDFMALDGATNGTRKMSAANPSVTTLTTSGVIAPGGSVHGANGTAANPSFAFNSDQDTGIYRIGANNIGVAAGGDKALDISSTGVVATTTLADQGGTIAAQRNGLAPRQGLVFDGTTGASCTLGSALTTDDFTLAHKLTVPLSAPATYTPLYGVSISGNYITNNSTLNVSLQTSAIRVIINNAAGSGGCYADIAGFVTAYAGKVVDVVVTRASGVVAVYFNGIAQTVTPIAYGSAPNSFAISIVGTQHTIGGTGGATNTVYSGNVTPIGIENRALSAAEVLALYQSSAPAGGDYAKQVAGTALITGNSSTFASGVGSWVVQGAASIANTTNKMSVTGVASATDGTKISVFATSSPYKYRLSVTISNLVGGTTIGVLDQGANQVGSLVSGANILEFTNSNGGGTNLFLVRGSSGAVTSFDVSAVTLTPLGLLLAPDSNNAGAGLEWLDVSGNRAHVVLPTSGVTWSLPSSQQIVVEASTSTNGNQQLGGASLIDVNKQWRIQSWTVNCSTGTPTISLGNVSAGTQYNVAAVLAAGNNDITLVTRFPSTANLWVNSNSTATLIHRIVLAPAN
jgi:hypothetical protein